MANSDPRTVSRRKLANARLGEAYNTMSDSMDALEQFMRKKISSRAELRLAKSLAHDLQISQGAYEEEIHYLMSTASCDEERNSLVERGANITDHALRTLTKFDKYQAQVQCDKPKEVLQLPHSEQKSRTPTNPIVNSAASIASDGGKHPLLPRKVAFSQPPSKVTSENQSKSRGSTDHVRNVGATGLGSPSLPNRVKSESTPTSTRDAKMDSIYVEFARKVQKFERKFNSAMRYTQCGATRDDCIHAKSELHTAFAELETFSDNHSMFGHDVDRASDKLDDAVAALADRCRAPDTGREPPRDDQAQQRVSSDSSKLVQFERMPIPKFSGKIVEYPNFRRKFKLLVEKHLPREIALIRLREESLTQGSNEARLVRAKNTLSSAWQALDQYFGRPSFVKDAILKELREVKVVTRPTDAVGIRDLVARVATARDDLTSIGMSNVLGDSAMSILMTKIPFVLREKIDEKLLDEDMSPANQVDLFISILERRAMILETHTLRSDAHGASMKTGGGNSSLASLDSHGNESDNEKWCLSQSTSDLQRPRRGPSDGQFKPKECVFHPNPRNRHSTAECQTIQCLAPSELKVVLSNRGLCLKCLCKHETSTCSAKVSCSESDCKSPGSHSTITHLVMSALTSVQDHTADSDDTETSEEACTEPDNDDTEVSSVLVSQHSEASSSLFLKCETNQNTKDTLNTQLGKNTIRPAHYAFVKASSGQFMQIQVFYDLGSDFSQVTNDLANSCGLRPSNHCSNFRVNTACSREPKSMGHTDLYTVPLYSRSGQRLMTVKCLGVDYIGSTKAGEVESVVRQFENSDFTTGDLLQPSAGEISILVGCNYPNLHPTPIKILGTVTLAESQFGVLVYGSHPKFGSQNLSQSASSSYIASMVDLAENAVKVALQSADAQPRHEIAEHFMASSPRVMSNTNTSLGLGYTCACVDHLQSVEEPCMSAPSSLKVSTQKSTPALSVGDRDLFDKMVEIEDQAICYNCGKCPVGESKSDAMNKRRMEIYRECITYHPDKKIFVAKMPWNESIQNLPDNYLSAEKRLGSITRSLSKNPELRNLYALEFEKVIEGGVLVEVTEEDDRKWKESGGKVWYVSHFPVLNDSSASTPLRPVFDPTVPFRGILLDRLWEHPPNLIPDISKLIMRFRERPVPIAVDIKKAYWSVYLDEMDSHLHRVLWNGLDMSKPIKVYKMTRNSWGSRPAGSICSLAMLMLAEMFAEKYPLVHQFISNQFYVDDGTFSCESIDDALSLARDTSWVMAQGGFQVKHFVIGTKSVDLSNQDREQMDLPDKVILGGEQTRILGVKWNPQTDTIGFSCRVNFSGKKRGSRVSPDIVESEFDDKFPGNLSLRMYLSQMASLFDPAGLATPYTIILKHELGRIFQLNGGWDKSIPHGRIDDITATHERCKEIIKMIYFLATIQFPRCVRPEFISENSIPILVIFADASQTSYGACAYFNWDLGTKCERDSRLVLAKARPIPKSNTNLTIPRAELMGTVLASRLLGAIRRATSYQIGEVVLITDSTIALGQITKSPYKLKTWVAARVEEIRETTPVNAWYHIASEKNVADDACRGLHPKYMGPNSRWQTGPNFLKMARTFWPIRPISDLGFKADLDKDPSKLELRHRDPRMDLDRSPSIPPRIANQATVHNVAVDQDQITMNSLFSLNIREPQLGDNWLKMRRFIARIIRFIENGHSMFRSFNKSAMPVDLKSWDQEQRNAWINQNDLFVPTHRELKMAEKYWILKSQQSMDIKCLKGGNKTICPEKCADGIWRSSVRTRNLADAPIILPPGNLANSILQWYHRIYHPGAQATLAASRQFFWILKGRWLANRLVRNCSRCHFLRKTSVNAQMAPIKLDQTKRTAIFENIAIDLCGPYLTIAEGRSTRKNPNLSKKVWILVIICRASRAVHFEVVEGYDTASLLAALDNFVNLRSAPKHIIADRGSQIVSAADTMEYLWTDSIQAKLQNHLVETTTWQFVPSGSHESLGIAERLVSTFKKTLLAVMHSEKPKLTKLHFSRVLYSIANIVNDRPLGLGRIDSNKLSENRLIRPNDLLLGKSSNSVESLVAFDDSDSYSGKRDAFLKLLRQKRAFVNEFWTKWYQVYFHTMAPVTKWYKSDRSIQVGDLVLIRDTNPVRGCWSWGEVHDTVKSHDGIVRKATIRYKSTSAKLPKHPTKGTHSKFVHKCVRDLVLLLCAEDRDDLHEDQVKMFQQ